ncbi:MAG: 5-deoxy-glucuronate isomerase [Actinomycetota bacterium]|nr:5-deoxy-glucuronate isomerase [Actinomycetota bacterium]
MSEKLHLPAGSTADGAYALAIPPEDAGWAYSGLRVVELAAGGTRPIRTGDEEMLVVPLSGGCTVECEGERIDLHGRDGVFTGVTDLAYLPRNTDATLTSAGGGRFALPSARCEGRRAPRYRAAADVPVELRGAGSCSRQVNNLCGADWPYADKLIAVEVLTPAGNWSSYPPHKHDEARTGAGGVAEVELEEIYYFEVADGPGGLGGDMGGGAPRGVAYQRVYGTAERPLDVLAEVRSGDVVLVPHGWHGPSMAAPGYDLYYLNVMAGPAPDRQWVVCDDPAHAWVRGTWADAGIDPRLPLTSAPNWSPS